jgi:hypothetical protein
MKKAKAVLPQRSQRKASLEIKNIGSNKTLVKLWLYID